jgi:hypothetical protein
MNQQDNRIELTSRISRPFPIRMINKLGSILSKLGIYTINLDEQSLSSIAIRRSALKDWGDRNFVLPFNILLKSINEDAKLDFFGRHMVREMFTNDLINRLRIFSVVQQNTDIVKIPISRPIFVIGFPRTGTTLLHNLLALDQESRSPKMWEVLNPASSLDKNNRQSSTLIGEAEKFVKAAYNLAPQLPAIHALSAIGPDECLKLIENTFISPHFLLFFNVPTYWDWLLKRKQEEFIEVYKYHRKQLQILNWYESGERWILKTPIHMFFLEALLGVYPDACIIHLHRDPHIAIPSFCSLAAANRRIFTGQQNFQQLGKLGIEIFKEMSNRAINARNSADQSQFYDVSYSKLVTNTSDTVHEIYEYFGLDYRHKLDKKIEKWLSENPQNKHGSHNYSLDQFGLSSEDINQAVKFYVERFNEFC